MKKLFLLLLISCSLFKVYSQGQGNTWIFGDSAGVHFVNGVPSAINSSILSRNEMSASISDSQGNLLFYTGQSANGGAFCCSDVFDRNNNFMPHGNGLKCNGSVTQGSLIIPMPDDSQKYYIFNIGLPPQFPPLGFYSLYYSVVDVSLNNNFGDVDLTKKNIPICDTAITEKMIGIKHANGRDWWIINHEWNTNVFYKYVVTPNGINGPYTQSIGDTVKGSAYAGQMAANSEGKKVAFAGVDGTLQLFDFDRCSGLFSNYFNLNGIPDSLTLGYYGCSFSPESSYLYTSTADSLFQFDLSATNIKASKTLIAGYTGAALGQIGIGQHLIGPDEKIYIAITNWAFNSCDSMTTHLSVINNPDLLGPACNFTPFSFPLINCSEVYAGLPNMPNYNLGSLVGSVCDTVTAVEEIKYNYKMIINPNPTKDVCTITASNFAKATLIIFDITGRILSSQTFSNKATLDISTLTKGVYIAELKDLDGKSVKGKIVKQ